LAPKKSLSVSEKAGNVHKFLGYAVSAARNVFVGLEEKGDLLFDFTVYEAILSAMVCKREEIIGEVLSNGGHADEEYYPKLLHLQFEKTLVGDFTEIS